MPPPSLAAQTTYTVDLNGPGFTSISSAANIAVAGDTIEVVGIVDPISGLPVAYTNGNGEVFPIQLQSGVDLRPTGSNSVYIWPTGGANPSSIIEVVGSSSPPETRILQVQVFGGQIGIDVSGSSATDSTNVVLQKVTLGRSTIDLTAIATNNATVDVVMNDCRITNLAIPLAENPGTLRSTSVGLQFHASEGTGIPKLNATINNLTARGTFAFLNGVALIPGLDADIERTAGQAFTRLIEVFSTGTTGTPGRTGIPETDINVAINGGILEGGAGLGAPGWDIGIYSMALPQDFTPLQNYRASSTVTVTGTEIKNFVEAGIYATAGRDVRSRIVVQGQSRISGTGNLSAHTPGDYFHSGIHLFARKGYLGLSVFDSAIEDNTGNGITLRAASTDVTSYMLSIPYGMPINVVRSQIHGNQGDGIELEVGVGSPQQPSTAPGIVGGTRLADTGFTRLDIGDINATIPFGQGVIDQCSISNNGEHGIRTHIDNGDDYFAFFRITNCFIWNNLLGGFLGDITSTIGGTGYLLSPILHCTFIGNGNNLTTPNNIDVTEPTGLSGRYFFDPVAGGDSVGMEIFNCIFDMQSSTRYDFGQNLETMLVDASPVSYFADTGIGGQGGSDTKIAIGGVRFNSANQILAFPYSNRNPVSYSGPIVATNRKAKQFFLSPTAPNPGIVDDTPNWQIVVAPETNTDFSGNIRPSVTSSLRDKGGDEK